MARARVKWNGAEVKARFNRATARGTIGIAERISGFGKRFVHKISGTLARSIHVAKASSGGLIEPRAENVLTSVGALVEVGSWIEYACVEEVGRQHRYMQPALEAVAPTAARTMRAAFRQEGF